MFLIYASTLLCYICTLSYIQELQPLFEIDPLLLRLFVKVTAFVDLESLIGKIPSSILLMRLAEECTSVYQVCNVYTYIL